MGSGTNLLKTGNSKTLSVNDRWTGRVGRVKRPDKNDSVVGDEPLQKYDRTPVSIWDKFSFCRRARRELKLGIKNAVLLNLTTEFVQFQS